MAEQTNLRKGRNLGPTLVVFGIVVLLLTGIVALVSGGGKQSQPTSGQETPSAQSLVTALPTAADVLTSTATIVPSDTPVATSIITQYLSYSPTPFPTPAPVITGEQGNKGVIRIGVDLPTSGADAADGIPARNGVQLAIEEANAQGEVIAGYKLQMYALDDAVNGVHNPQQGAANALAFIADDNVVAVVGPFNSNVARAMMPLLNQANLPHISPANTNEKLTKPEYGETQNYRPTGSITYFRVCPTDDLQGPAAADYAFDTLGLKTVYILDDQEAYGKGVADLFEQEFKIKGGEVISHDGVPIGTTNFKTIQMGIIAMKPDFVFYGGLTSNGIGLFRKQMKDTMPGVLLIGSDGIVERQFTDDAGDNAANSYGTVAAINAEALPSANEFLTHYAARFNSKAGQYSANTYDATNIIIAAIRAGAANWKDSDPTTNREMVRTAIAATKDFNGTTGVTSFDRNGDTTNHLISIYKVDAQNTWQWADHVRVGALPPPLPTATPSPLPTMPAEDTPSPFPTLSQVTTPTLILWTTEEGDTLSWLQQAAQQFGWQNKEQAYVTVEHKDKDKLVSDFKQAVANGGTLPDMIWADSDVIPTLSTGLLITFTDTLLGANYNDKFIKPLADGAKYRGWTWGVPLYPQNYLMLLYNRRLIPNPPTNSDEMINMAKSITKGKGDERGYGLAYSQNDALWLNAFLGSYAGGLISEPTDPHTAQGLLNTPEMVKTLQFLHDLKFQAQIMPDDGDYYAADKLFREGKAGMLITGDWALSSYLSDTADDHGKHLKSSLNFEFGIAPIPLMSETGTYPAPLVDGKYLMFTGRYVYDPVFATTMRRFSDFITSRDEQISLAANRLRPAALSELMFTSSLLATNPQIQDMGTAVLKSRPRPLVLQMRCAFDAEKQPLQAVMADKLTAPDAAKAMQASYDACAKDIGR